MKKTLSIIMMAALLIIAGACADSARKNLKAGIDSTKNSLPIDLGPIGSFDAISYDEDSNEVIFSYTLNEEYSDMDMMARNDSLQKESICVYLRSEGANKLLSSMCDAGASLTTEFLGSDSGKGHSITFTNDELKALRSQGSKSTAENDEEQLAAMAVSANAECPMDLGDGMVMTEVRMADGFMEYCYETTGEDYNFEPKDMPQIKKNLRDELRTFYSGPVGERFKELFFRTGTGIRYLFHNTDTDVTFEVEFAPAEIRRL